MKVSVLTPLSLIVALVLALSGVGITQGPQSLSASPSPMGEEPAAKTESDPSQVTAALHSNPVMFIENVGQFDERARFQVRGGTGTMWLADDAIWVTVFEQRSKEAEEQGSRGAEAHSPRHLRTSAPLPRKGVNLKLSFVGANPHPRMEPFDRPDTVVSYFIGSDPDEWHPDVPVWGGVRYVDLYPGVDLEITSESGHWSWRAVADDEMVLSQVRLRVEGSEALDLDGNRLHLTTAVDDLALPLLTIKGAIPDDQPVIFSVEHGIYEVPSPFSSARLTAGISAKATGASDLLYSTFLGGSGLDYGSAIAVDGSGGAYVTGGTESPDFPTAPGAFDTSNNDNRDVFVVKLNADGTGLAYATFLGGSEWEGGWAIAVDRTGSAYVTGETESSDFPTTTGSFDTSHNGNYDAFVVKLNGAGSALSYATLLGGSEWDRGWAIAVDEWGSTYVTGETWSWLSSEFPTTPGAFDTSYNGNGDAFVTKLNASGTGLIYSTLLGGWSGTDRGCAIAVDGAGSVYVTGNTLSSEFPTTAGAFDSSCNGGGSSFFCWDAFAAKLNPVGSELTYATFLGGSEWEEGNGIAVDATGSIYMTGYTNSSDFPTTAGAFDTSHGGGTCGTEPHTYPCPDAFVVKLSPNGKALDYATFLGGSDSDCSWWNCAIAVDSAGSAYVAGDTSSYDFPTTAQGFDTNLDGGGDAFVSKLNPTGSNLAYATFLGGSDDDYGKAIALDEVGRVYVAGGTKSFDFPTTAGAFDTSYNGSITYGGDAFVAKLALGSGLGPSPGYVELVGQIGGRTDAVAVQGDYAYIGQLDRLVVMDISNPASPTRVGQTWLRHLANGIFVLGSYAYIATIEGLQVIDVSDPVTPHEVGYYALWGYSDVFVLSSYAYAVGPSKLDVIDVSNPANPRKIGEFDGLAPRQATWRVFVLGDYAYATSWGLQVLDISDPANPHYAGGWYEGLPSDIFVSESYAYVADGDRGLRVVDVSEPTNPHEEGFYDTPGSAVGVAVVGRYAYIADGESGLRIISIFDPAHPGEVGFYDTPGFAKGVAVAEGYIYVADGDGGLLILRFTGGRASNTWSYQTDTPPTIDGDLADWVIGASLSLSAETAEGLFGPSIPHDANDLSADLRSLWDANNLYLAVRVRDDVLVADSEALSDDDCVVLGIDGVFDHSPGGGDDHEYDVGWDGRMTDFGAPTSAIQGAAQVTPEGYVVEIAIPLSELGGSPLQHGRIIGLALGLRDDDDGGPRDSFLVRDGDHTDDSSAEYGRLHLLGTTLTFQHKANEYTLTQDTYISAWCPTVNHNSGSDAELLHLRSRDVMAALLYFNLAPLDGNLVIDEATLTVYAAWRSNANPMTVSSYRLLRAWDPDDATWLRASAQEQWGEPGANDTEADRLDTPSDMVEFNGVGYYDFDVTDMVQVWHANPDDNKGVIPKTGPGDWVEYMLGAAENQRQDWRPRLTVRYHLPQPEPTTYSISGRVTDTNSNPIASVTISAGGSTSTTTDSNGNYTLSGLAAGTYTITPSKSGHTFSPASRTVSVPPDATGQDFTGILQTYSISGRVTDGGGNPIPGVTISDDAGHTATTDSNGNYTLSGLAAGTYTITPSKSGYSFSPASRTVSVPPDATGQDFIGVLQTYSISGRVTDGGGNPIPGVTISDGAGHTATTDSNGNYTLGGLAAGIYTIAPSKSGYTFLPPSLPVIVPPDATGQDFTGTPTTSTIQVETKPPQLSQEDSLHTVVLQGVVTTTTSTTVWFEWGEELNLSTSQNTDTSTVVGTGMEVTASLQLPPTDSVGRPFYYRIAAGDASNPQRGGVQRILILLGDPVVRFPTGYPKPPYWNTYDRLIHYYTHQAGWPAPVVKAILAHESHWDFYQYGHFNQHPERSFLYEPVTVDWARVYKATSTPRVNETLKPYLLPNNLPSEWPYNRYWDTTVVIPSDVQNMDMVGRCSFSDLGRKKDPYYSDNCIRWREAMSRTNWSRSPITDTYRVLYGITNPATSSTTASQIISLTAQYRLASSSGLGQVVYLSHYDRVQRISGRSSPPPPETLYNPELNIRIAVDYLKELKDRPVCRGSGIQEGRWDNQDDWERAVRGYNDGKCNLTGYTKYNGLSHISNLLSAASPVLAPPDFDARGILVPTTTGLMAAAGAGSLAGPGEFEVDRSVADIKGLGQAQLMVLSAWVTDPTGGVDYGKLTIFTDAAGSVVEWESPPLEGVLASGVVLTETLPEGGPPLIATLWGAGAHGTRAYLFRWDGQTFRAIQRAGLDGTPAADFFGDAGVDLGEGGITTVSRDGQSPLSIFHADVYAWDAASQTFAWIREETLSNEERTYRVYLPLVLRNC